MKIYPETQIPALTKDNYDNSIAEIKENPKTANENSN